MPGLKVVVALAALGLAWSSTAFAGDGALRVVCVVDGQLYGKGEIRIGGKVRGECPRLDIILPAGEHAVSVDHVIGDGSLFRGTATATIREDSATQVSATRIEVALAKVFTEEFYYNKQDWSSLRQIYPTGKYADEAVYRTVSPREYLEKFPAGKFVAEARRDVERLTTLSPDAGKVFRDCPTCPEMVIIPPGSFMMGSPSGEKDSYDNERPQHRVTIAVPFSLGKAEVTQAEWEAVMGNNPSKFRGTNRPVEQVSWDDVQVFISKLNAKTGKRYRLPSEAEWEYAARAGTTTRHSWGDDVGKGNANCEGCGSQWDNRETAPVGSFRPNRFGLYDMHGNVWEWVQDCWHDNYSGAPSDGSAWTGPNSCPRVTRGGSWFYDPWDLRSAYRDVSSPVDRSYDLGVRLARTL